MPYPCSVWSVSESNIIESICSEVVKLLTIALKKIISRVEGLLIFYVSVCSYVFEVANILNSPL